MSIIKRTWEVLAQDLFHCLDLEFHDVRVLLELVGTTDALPGKVSPQKLDQHVGDRLEVISS